MLTAAPRGIGEHARLQQVTGNPWNSKVLGVLENTLSQIVGAWSHDCVPASVESECGEPASVESKKCMQAGVESECGKRASVESKKGARSSQRNCQNRQYSGLAGAF
jgi:hypothetical protein